MRKVFKVAAPVAVGVVAVAATPAVIGALGFGTVGITAGSLAAKLMSVAATTGYVAITWDRFAACCTKSCPFHPYLALHHTTKHP